MIHRFVRTVAVGMAVGMLISTGPAAAESITIKIGTFVPEKSGGVARVIKPWMNAVQKDVGGKVKLVGYWGGTLGKSPFKQYELVKNGVADIGWVQPAYTPGQFPELQILDLPFFVKNSMEASLLGQRLYEAGLLTGFDQVHLIGHWGIGPNALFTRDKAGSLAELKGLKIRATSSVTGRWLSSIGAAPLTISPIKMNEMLNRKSIDGGIQGVTGMRTFKSWPLVSNVIEVPLGAIPFLILMNKKKWNSLPPDIQKAFMKHGGETIARTGGKAFDQSNAKILSDASKAGKHSFANISAAELAGAEKAAIKDVHDWWIKKTPNGAVVYKKAQEILASIRKGT